MKLVRRGHVPQRMCAGCGRRASRYDLVRFCIEDRGDKSVLAIDRAGKGAGRGTWLCPDTGCFDAAVKRGSLLRHLRAEVNADNLRQDLIEHITDLERADGKKESI